MPSSGAFTTCEHSDGGEFTPHELATDLVLVRMHMLGIDTTGVRVEALSAEFITQGDIDFLESVCRSLGRCPPGDDFFPLRLTVLLHEIDHSAPWPADERRSYAEYWAVAAFERHGPMRVRLPAAFFEMDIEGAATALWSAVVVALAAARSPTDGPNA